MKIAIFGTSGFAREVYDICKVVGYEEIVLISKDYKDAEELNGMNYKVIEEQFVYKLHKENYKFAIGVGENNIREKIYEKYKEFIFPNLIHSSATFGHFQNNAISSRKGNIVCAGVRFTTNIKYGNFGVFNLNSTIGHDSIIEDFINLAPGVNISGNVLLKRCCYLGTNSTVLQGESLYKKMVIGNSSTVGAGAVVVREVVNNTVVVGAPAKELVRKVKD